MRENETDKSRDLITPDDERAYDITLRALLKMDAVSSEAQHLLALEMVNIMNHVLQKGQTLHQALTVKEIADKLLAFNCVAAFETICEGHADDPDFCSKSMMELIMIIIRRYGWAISSQTLDKLLGNCDEYPQSLASLIGLGMIKYATQVDGNAACFYFPVNG
nr:MAG TPA_asm: hypothetical protein [Caudoviricetes sp.]